MQPNYDEATAGALAAFGLGFFIFIFAFTAFFIICQWKIFTKAGQPGWASIVPIYSYVIAMRIAGRPWWHMFLMIIPIYGLIVAIQDLNAFCKSYGRSSGFTAGMIFLPIVFYPILAFDKSIVYVGPGGIPNVDSQVDSIGVPAV